MIKYFLFILTSISISTFGFVELQYNKANLKHLNFTYPLRVWEPKPILNHLYPLDFIVNYRFDNMGYGFNIYPVQLPNGDAFSWTSHNLQFPYMKIRKFGDRFQCHFK